MGFSPSLTDGGSHRTLIDVPVTHWRLRNVNVVVPPHPWGLFTSNYHLSVRGTSIPFRNLSSVETSGSMGPPRMDSRSVVTLRPTTTPPCTRNLSPPNSQVSVETGVRPTEGFSVNKSSGYPYTACNPTQLLSFSTTDISCAIRTSVTGETRRDGLSVPHRPRVQSVSVG